MSKLQHGNRYGQETRDLFVDLVCSGLGAGEAAARVGASARSGQLWWHQSGEMPLNPTRAGSGLADPAPEGALDGGRYLSLSERIVIQVCLRQGWSYARIGREVGRDRAVVWREVARHRSPDGMYYATRAHNRAHQLRRRRKIPKLVARPEVAEFIADAMDEGWSPKLISEVLAGLFPDDRSMQVSHETIYRALYVQTRGVLRADLRVSDGLCKRGGAGSVKETL